MTSSLHVSLPDDMREFVDERAKGTRQFSTPSEYVRALIRDDMAQERERAYIHRELVKSAADIAAGKLHSAASVRSRSAQVLQEFQELRNDARE